jgi:hypothetical protein
LGWYSTNPSPGTTCPADKYDLNLQAEIWQYTPTTNAWKRVFQSPNDIPNPRAPGKFISPDIAFRGMIVANNMLLVGGVTAGEYIPELTADHPPRILTSTDGETFTPVPHNIGTINYALSNVPVPAIGFRAMELLNGKLYVTASPALVGDGVILEAASLAALPSITAQASSQGAAAATSRRDRSTPSATPSPTSTVTATPTPTASIPSLSFTQVSPKALRVFELEVFNNQLYVGTGDDQQGYSVWRTTAVGTPPYAFTPIVTGGAGRGPTMTSVVSMHPYKGRLYVGSSGWFSTLLPNSELIRVNPDDTWQLVVGNSRITSQGITNPISGLPDGFFNPFNTHFWRMEDHAGILMLGTNDLSWAFMGILDPLIGWQYGFDLFSTIDGRFWVLETLNGFGNPFEFGARTMVTSPTGAFVGSANHAQGTTVFRGLPIFDFSGVTGLAGTSLQAPGRLEAESKDGSILLSWDGVPGTSRYEVFRSTFQSNQQLNVGSPLNVPQVPNDGRRLLVPAGLQVGALAADAWIPGPFTSIGTTNDLFYEDRTAASGVHYAYYVKADGMGGAASRSSNMVVTPNNASAVTFDQLVTIVQNLSGRGKFHGDPGQFVRSVTDARDKAKKGDIGGASQIVSALRQQINLHQVGGLDALDTEDLEAAVGKLERRLALVRAGMLSVSQLETGVPDRGPQPSPGVPTPGTATPGSPTPGSATPPASPTPPPTPTPPDPRSSRAPGSR